MEDIAPSLLKKIQEDFQVMFDKSKVISSIYSKVRDGTATYVEANEFAIETGGILARSFEQNISSEVLPDGRMYYNIAKRIIEPTMTNNYDLITDVTNQIQTSLNKSAKIGIKAIKPELNQDRIRGIVNKVSEAETYDDVAWVLDEPVKNFSQSIVDDSIRTNSEFHGNAGMRPRIIRELSGGCCEWCATVAGTYTYPDVPKDVYRRHHRCRCTVEYYPGDGKFQNVHSKQWHNDTSEEQKESRQKIKVKNDKKTWIKENIEDVTEEYKYYASPGEGKMLVDKGVRAEDIKTAEWMHNTLGGDIHVLKESEQYKIKTPDAYWKGAYIEFKSASTKNSIDDRLRKAGTQLAETLERDGKAGDLRRILLDVTRRTMDRDDVIEEIAKRLPIRAKGKMDILVKDNDKLLIVMRYNNQ